MPYRLDTRGFAEKPRITLVGVGGTGGFVADSLCRLFTGRPMELVLVDHDRVEPHNLFRQNFHRGDVGRHKSEALAERLARLYGRTIGYRTEPFMMINGAYPGMNRYSETLMISCVDNASARREMNNAQKNGSDWWIDAGNGERWGQVLIGNASRNQLQGKSFQDGFCHHLPNPLLQRPDLMTEVPHAPPEVDCAAALDLTDQDPTINQTIAMIVLQVVRRMAAVECPFMALYLDLESGTLTPRLRDPRERCSHHGPEHRLAHRPGAKQERRTPESRGRHREHVGIPLGTGRRRRRRRR